MAAAGAKRPVEILAQTVIPPHARAVQTMLVSPELWTNAKLKV
jgi:hypothetical protein